MILALLSAVWGATTLMSLSDVVREADRIVVGSVNAEDAASRTSVVSLTRTLKGDPGITDSVLVAWPEVMPPNVLGGFPGFGKGNAMWFLEPLSTDRCRALHVLNLPADRGVSEPGVRPSDTSPEPALHTVVRELQAVTESGDRAATRDAYGALRTLRGEEATSGPMAGWHQVVLSRVEQALSSSRVELPPGIVETVRAITDPTLVPALGRIALARDSGPRLTREVAYALRAIHTRATLPFLFELLDAADPDVRYQAVAGFGTFVAENWPTRTEAMQHAFPSTDLFRDDMNRYTLFWKEWYAANLRPIERPSPIEN